MLQPVDIAVAFAAAYRWKQDGAWSPKDVHDDLGLAWSSLNLSLQRLGEANIVRRGRVHRQALAALLPVLQYLVPARPDLARRVVGVPTGASAPVFEDRILSAIPLVWESEHGGVEGAFVQPLHPSIPDAVSEDPARYALFACLDAARSGRAREYGIAAEKIRELAGLPTPVEV
ncbi:MAG: hypothetical protein JRI25_03850 [Deltaproteobacteria bacterium]|nr:hypothetical protein [Deltaproteobacteria bacterium]